MGPLPSSQGQREGHCFCGLDFEARVHPLLIPALGQGLMRQTHPSASHPSPESDPLVLLPENLKGGPQSGETLSRQGADPAPQSRLSSRKLARLGASK